MQFFVVVFLGVQSYMYFADMQHKMHKLCYHMLAAHDACSLYVLHHALTYQVGSCNSTWDYN